MALFRWRGDGAGTKSDWSDGRNWINAAGAAYGAGVYPGVVPAQYDEVVFDAALGASALSPAGRDCSADEVLLSLKVGSSYNGNIGSASAALQVATRAEADGGLVVISPANDRDVFLSSTAAGTLYRVSILNGDVSLGGAISNLSILKGNVTIAAGAVITDPFHVGQLVSPTDARVTIAAGVTIANPDVSGGIIDCSSAITGTLEIYTGYWKQSGDVPLIEQYGGTIEWRSGTISDANVYAGTLDGSKSVTPKTLTQARVYEKGTLNLNNNAGNITVTNWVEITKGNVIWPSAQMLYLVA